MFLHSTQPPLGSASSFSLDQPWNLPPPFPSRAAGLGEKFCYPLLEILPLQSRFQFSPSRSAARGAFAEEGRQAAFSDILPPLQRLSSGSFLGMPPAGCALLMTLLTNIGRAPSFSDRSDEGEVGVVLFFEDAFLVEVSKRRKEQNLFPSRRLAGSRLGSNSPRKFFPTRTSYINPHHDLPLEAFLFSLPLPYFTRRALLTRLLP